MFEIYATKSLNQKFEAIMNDLPKERHNKILHFLKNTPLGHPNHKMKSKKVGKNCQYDLTESDRLIYRVMKREKKVIVGFIGDHDDANTYLRKHR